MPSLLGIIHQLEDILTTQFETRQRGDTADFDFIGIFYLCSLLTVGTELWNATTMLRKRAPPQIFNESSGECKPQLNSTDTEA